jgi:hypothetical protein
MATSRKLPFWPSHAHRWVNCSGQPWILQALTGKKKADSPDAVVGTQAHEYLACLLKGSKGKTDISKLNAENLEVVESTAKELRFLAELDGGKLHVEERQILKFSSAVISMRIDVYWVANEITIIDYKNGMLPVSPYNNCQLDLYAIALRQKYPGKPVNVGICQPRTGKSCEIIPVSNERLDAQEKNFSAAITRAIAYPTYKSGPWCWRCDGLRGYCPAQLETLIRAVVEQGGDWAQTELHNSLPTWILEHKKQIQDYMQSVESEIFDRLSNGYEVKGFGLREYEGHRTWKDPSDVPTALATILGGTEYDWERTVTKPITITELDVALKKQPKETLERVRELIYRPIKTRIEKNDESEEYGSIEEMEE